MTQATGFNPQNPFNLDQPALGTPLSESLGTLTGSSTGGAPTDAGPKPKLSGSGSSSHGAQPSGGSALSSTGGALADAGPKPVLSSGSTGLFQTDQPSSGSTLPASGDAQDYVGSNAPVTATKPQSSGPISSQPQTSQSGDPVTSIITGLGGAAAAAPMAAVEAITTKLGHPDTAGQISSGLKTLQGHAGNAANAAAQYLPTSDQVSQGISNAANTVKTYLPGQGPATTDPNATPTATGQQPGLTSQAGTMASNVATQVQSGVSAAASTISSYLPSSLTGTTTSHKDSAPTTTPHSTVLASEQSGTAPHTAAGNYSTLPNNSSTASATGAQVPPAVI